MTEQTEPTPETEPLPDDAQDPANDLIDEQDYEFSRADMLALFDDDDGKSDSAAPEEEGGVEPDAGDDTPLEPAAEEPAPKPEPEPTPAPEPAPYVEFAGRQYPVDQVGQLIEWVENLTPEQWAALNPSTQPEPEPAFTPPAEDEIVDPALAQYVEQRFAHLEQQQQLLVQQQEAAAAQLAAQREAELLSAIDTARRGVADKYGLTDIEAKRLVELSNQSTVAGAIVQTGDLVGDPVGTITAALDAVYWVTPEYRDRAIQTQVQEQATTLAAEMGVQSSLEERKQLQAGLVGQGAATPRTTTPAPRTEEEHLAEAYRIARESMSTN